MRHLLVLVMALCHIPRLCAWIPLSSPLTSASTINDVCFSPALLARLRDSSFAQQQQSVPQNKRIQRKLRLKDGQVIPIISRHVQLAADWNVTIFEQDETAEIVEHYWNVQSRGGGGRSLDGGTVLDPFGLVTWPGSVVAAQEMREHHQASIRNATVVVLGAGCGVEAQAAAMLGAKRIIATDIHPTTLELLRYGAGQAGLGDVIKVQVLDLFDARQAIPPCDVLLASDVLYSSRLATQVGDRILEVLQRQKPPPKVLVTDSQRFVETDFVPKLMSTLRDESIRWQERDLNAFTGSGVMVDQDQTYNVQVRVLAIGF